MLIFTNVSGRTCTVQGYPGVTLDWGTTIKNVLNAQRKLTGFLFDQHLTSAPTVRLAPGASAYAGLEFSLSNGQHCYGIGSGELEVTPPNTTATVGVEIMTPDICSNFVVHPVLVLSGPLG